MKVVVLLFIVLLILMLSRAEQYETARTPDEDPKLNMEEYVVDENSKVDKDLLQKIVLETNKYITEKTGLCNYIIETTDMKIYAHKKNKTKLYKCTFMSVKEGGFSYGMSYTVEVIVANNEISIINANKQPMDVKPPANSSPFMKDIQGHQYLAYEEIQDSELDLLKL